MPFGGKKDWRPTEPGRGSGYLRVLRAANPYEFPVELWVLREGVNRNRWDYQNLKECYQTFLGQPILCAYIGPQVGDGHNAQEKRDPKTGETYYSFIDGRSERIVGALSDDKADLELRSRDGQVWLVAKGRLFAFYARELVEKIVRQGQMEVSAETDVLEQRREGDVEVFTRWAGLGVTILGDQVAPAIPGANIRRLATMREELRQVKLQAAALTAKTHDDNTTKNDQKGEGVRKPMKLLSKKQLAQLAPKFAPCKVLAAAQVDQDIRVCLLSETGDTLIYDWKNPKDPENEIKLSRAEKVEVNARFQVSQEDFAEVEVGELFDSLLAKLNAANSQLESTQKTLAQRDGQLEAMRQAETARRLSAAKKAAEDTLAAFNANRKEAIPQSSIANVLERIEKGGFAACVGEDGQWTGETAVREAVLARCGQAVMEQDRQEAEKNRQTYVWNHQSPQTNPDDGTLEGQLNKWLSNN